MSGQEVNKSMGSKASVELQQALEGWREAVFTDGTIGYLKNPTTQSITSKGEKHDE